MTGEVPRIDTAKLQKAFADLGVAMDQAASEIRYFGTVGRAAQLHRHGKPAEAAATLAELPQEQRDSTHRFARWLIGDEPE